MLTAPLTPGMHGARWLVHEFTGGLLQVRRDLLKDVPEELQPDVNGWQTAGRFAEIGTPYAEMSQPDMTPEKRRAARLRSAQILTLAGCTGLAVARSGEQDMGDFLQSVRNGLTMGQISVYEQPDPYRAAILRYSQALHERFGFSNESEPPAWGQTIDALFGGFNELLLEQAAESAPRRRDPQRLLQIAVEAGGICTQMAAVAAAAPENIQRFARYLPAAAAFGGIGFVEEGVTQVKIGRLETYASALIRQQGDLSPRGIHEGIRQAHEMRKNTQAELIDAGLRKLAPGRERNAFGSQLWFALHVYPFQRLVKRPGRDKRIAQQLR